MNRSPVILLIACCVALLCSCRSMHKSQSRKVAVKDSLATTATSTTRESKFDSIATKSTDSTSLTITAELPSGGEIEFMPESGDSLAAIPSTKVKLGPGAKITYHKKKISIQEVTSKEQHDSTAINTNSAVKVHGEENSAQKDKDVQGGVPWFGLGILALLLILAIYSYKKWLT